MRVVVRCLVLAGFGGLAACAQLQFEPGVPGYPYPTTISTYWGSETCCGLTRQKVPTASAGANAIH